jgi:predicted nucleic acid-binding OB-fold protein
MQNPKRNVMNAIKMNRLELLEIVKANKEKHVTEFVESVEDYKNLVLKIAQANVKLAKTADLEQFKSIKAMPSTPVSYEDSYRRAIRMLELSVDEIIEVEEDVFNQLVLDEWSWKRSFTASTMSYKVGAGF